MKKGKKYSTFDSDLLMSTDKEGLDEVSQAEHDLLTDNLLTIAASYGLIPEKQYRTWYEGNIDGYRTNKGSLSNNWIGYWKGARMAPHTDVSEPGGNGKAPDGFSLDLIMIGTLTAVPINKDYEEFGTKLFSFSSEGYGNFEGLGVRTLPGDVLMIGPPASTIWKHRVPSTRCFRTVTMQWRKWWGAFTTEMPI